jgi:hypothetical protein
LVDVEEDADELSCAKEAGGRSRKKITITSGKTPAERVERRKGFMEAP